MKWIAFLITFMIISSLTCYFSVILSPDTHAEKIFVKAYVQEHLTYQADHPKIMVSTNCQWGYSLFSSLEGYSVDHSVGPIEQEIQSPQKNFILVANF